LTLQLEKGISIYDILDKNTYVSNTQIVNLDVANHPEVLTEIEDKLQYEDLLTAETIFEAFKKNPEVLYSVVDVLDTKIKLTRKDENGKMLSRNSTLRKQLKRSLNLYFSQESYTENNFDDFALSLTSDINQEKFCLIVQSNKMTTSVTTTANETLKRNPEKG